jgi:hypothetical protein
MRSLGVKDQDTQITRGAVNPMFSSLCNVLVQLVTINSWVGTALTELNIYIIHLISAASCKSRWPPFENSFSNTLASKTGTMLNFAFVVKRPQYITLG